MSTKMVKQIIWFCVAGILGFVVELSIIQVGISMSFGPIWPRFVSLPMAIWVTFLVNKNLSFKTEVKPDSNYFSAYFIFMLLSAALNFGLYTTAILSGINPTISLALAITITATFNFVMSRFIFSRPQH